MCHQAQQHWSHNLPSPPALEVVSFLLSILLPGSAGEQERKPSIWRPGMLAALDWKGEKAPEAA